MPNDPHMIFIGGCPRSGTTLLKRILDADDQIYCGPEFGHLPRICENYARMLKDAEHKQGGTFYSKESIRACFREFILGFVFSVLNRYSTKVFAEKTPDNIKCFSELHQLFPDAFLIHMIRNPFDVIASYMKIGKRSDKITNLHPHFFAPKLAASHWKKIIVTAENNKNRPASETFKKKYFVIRYEDIVLDTTKHLQRLYKHIHLNFNDRIVHLSASKGDPKFFGQQFYTEEEYFRKIETSSIGRWRNELDNQQFEDVREVIAHVLPYFGYTEDGEFHKLPDNDE